MAVILSGAPGALCVPVEWAGSVITISVKPFHMNSLCYLDWKGFFLLLFRKLFVHREC